MSKNKPFTIMDKCAAHLERIAAERKSVAAERNSFVLQKIDEALPRLIPADMNVDWDLFFSINDDVLAGIKEREYFVLPVMLNGRYIESRNEMPRVSWRQGRSDGNASAWYAHLELDGMVITKAEDWWTGPAFRAVLEAYRTGLVLNDLQM